MEKEETSPMPVMTSPSHASVERPSALTHHEQTDLPTPPLSPPAPPKFSPEHPSHPDSVDSNNKEDDSTDELNAAEISVNEKKVIPASLNGNHSDSTPPIKVNPAKDLDPLGLVARCAQLEHTCALLESRNRTLEEDLDHLRDDNKLINTKLLSIMSAVAKLSSRQINHITTDTSNSSTDQCKGTDQSKAGVVQGQKPSEGVIDEEKLKVDQREKALEIQLGGITQRLAAGDQGLKDLTARVDVVDGKADWLESELQRFVRRHSIIIENFCPKEDRSASEIFLVFANKVLGVALDDSDIDSLHLVDRPAGSGGAGSPAKGAPSGGPQRPRPVLVTFACYRARAQVYRAWLTFRTEGAQGAGGAAGSTGALAGERGQGLCIREFLTEAQESVYREAAGARDKKRVADCWTFKGKTFVRTLGGEIREFVNSEQSIPREDGKYSACVVM